MLVGKQGQREHTDMPLTQMTLWRHNVRQKPRLIPIPIHLLVPSKVFQTTKKMEFLLH